MICKNCKTEIPEGNGFCTACGQKVEAETAAFTFHRAGGLNGGGEGIGAVAEEKTAVSGLIFSNNIRSKGAKAASPEEQPMDTPAQTGRETPETVPAGTEPVALPAKSKKKKIKPSKLRKKGLIAAICAAVLVMAILVTGYFTSWFGLFGPAAQIVSATEKMLAAENFTVEFTVTEKMPGMKRANESIQGLMYVSVDPEEQELTVHGELKSNRETLEFAIYNGHAIWKNSDGSFSGGAFGGFEELDIGDLLDDIFEAYEELDGKNFSSADLVDALMGQGTSYEFRGAVDFDELDEAIVAYLKELNSGKWMKENAGYSIKWDGLEKKLSFRPDIYKFLKESAPFFKKAVVDRYAYSGFMDDLSEMKKEMRDIDPRITVGIKGGKLTEVEVDFTYEGYDEVHIELKISDYGKTEIDTDELADYLDQARNRW